MFLKFKRYVYFCIDYILNFEKLWVGFVILLLYENDCYINYLFCFVFFLICVFVVYK